MGWIRLCIFPIHQNWASVQPGSGCGGLTLPLPGWDWLLCLVRHRLQGTVDHLYLARISLNRLWSCKDCWNFMPLMSSIGVNRHLFLAVLDFYLEIFMGKGGLQVFSRNFPSLLLFRALPDWGNLGLGKAWGSVAALLLRFLVGDEVARKDPGVMWGRTSSLESRHGAVSSFWYLKLEWREHQPIPQIRYSGLGNGWRAAGAASVPS